VLLRQQLQLLYVDSASALQYYPAAAHSNPRDLILLIYDTLLCAAMASCVGVCCVLVDSTTVLTPADPDITGPLSRGVRHYRPTHAGGLLPPAALRVSCSEDSDDDTVAAAAMPPGMAMLPHLNVCTNTAGPLGLLAAFAELTAAGLVQVAVYVHIGTTIHYYAVNPAGPLPPPWWPHLGEEGSAEVRLNAPHMADYL
jgi:hypothetical protein